MITTPTTTTKWRHENDFSLSGFTIPWSGRDREVWMQVALLAAGVAQQTRIDERAARLNTSSEAVLGFFKTLQEEDVPVEQLHTKLTGVG